MRLHDKVTDGQLLDMLEMAACGHTRAQIADRFGFGKNQVIGILFRVNREADMAEATPPPPGRRPVAKPENRNGGMPQRWWIDGLLRRERRK